MQTMLLDCTSHEYRWYAGLSVCSADSAGRASKTNGSSLQLQPYQPATGVYYVLM